MTTSRRRPGGPVRRAAAAVGDRVVSLRPESIVVAAVRRAGTTELAIETVSEPLAVLCRSLDEHADLHPRGRRAARRRLVDALVCRAQASAAASATGVDEQPLERPVVVAAPPGESGRRLRGLLRGAGRAADDGARLEVACASMEPELDWFVPGWAEWFDSAPPEQGFRWLRRLLLLEGDPAEGPRTWRLDAPQLLEQLEAVTASFGPRAVVLLGGDRDRMAEEGAAEIEARRARWSWRTDPVGVRRYWSWRLERMEERCQDARGSLSGVEVIEVSLDRLDAEPDRLGEELRDRLGPLP